MTSPTTLLRVDYRDRDAPPSRRRLRVLAGVASLVIAVIALYSLSGFVTRTGYVPPDLASTSTEIAPGPKATQPVIDMTARGI